MAPMHRSRLKSEPMSEALHHSTRGCGLEQDKLSSTMTSLGGKCSGDDYGYDIGIVEVDSKRRII